MLVYTNLHKKVLKANAVDQKLCRFEELFGSNHIQYMFGNTTPELQSQNVSRVKQETFDYSHYYRSKTC